MTRIAVLLLLFLSFGCSSAGPLYKGKIADEHLRTPVNNFTVTFTDKRKSKSARALNINKITFGGEGDQVSAPPPKDIDKAFKNIIEKSKIKSDSNINFEVELIEGIQKFRATGFLEIEYVEVTLNIKASDLDSGTTIDEIESKSWGQKKSMDANNYKINRMYLNVFLDAFKKGISKLKLLPTQTESP